MCDNIKSNKLSYKIFSSINSINEEEWNFELELGDFYMNYDFLNITEKTTIGIDSYYYIMMYNEGVKIANIVLFSVELDFYNLVGNSAKKIISRFRKISKNSFFLKTLFCGLPISTVDNSIRIYKKEYTNEILELLDQIVKKVANKENAKIIFYKDFSNTEIEHFALLEEKSNTLISGLPSNNITIKWKTFEEYVNSLNKRYRNPLKKILKKREELTIIVTDEDLAVFDSKFYDLYNQVNSSSEFQLEKLSLNFFKDIIANKNLSTKLILIKKDDLLLGHVSIIEKNESFVPLFLGYDKALNKDYDVYFNLVYKILEVAIEEKKKYIKFGQTADYFKQKMGCYSTSVWWYIYISSPFLRPFTRYIFAKLFPPIEDYKFELFKN